MTSFRREKSASQSGIVIARGRGMPSNTALRANLHLVVDNTPKSTGINRDLVATARIQRFQLERLIAIEDEEPDDVDPTDVHSDDEPTVEEAAPRVPSDIPSPLGDSEPPPPVPELTAVMRAPVVPAVPPPFVPIAGVPTGSRASLGPEAYAAARAAREVARQEQASQSRTKWIVVGIWATAFVLAGSLAWVVGHDHTDAPVPIVTE